MPIADDFGQLTQIPPGFGDGEFTFEVWVRLDPTLPVGPAGGTSTRNWSSSDPAPYSSDTWWYAGNFLVDGFNNGNSSAGTFGIQIIGGGRVRWTLGDGSPITGGVLAVQAVPSSAGPGLLDGAWHHVAAVRRWQGTSEARLELWVDGVLVGTETSQRRTNMRQWWNAWSGFPANQPGWFIGAEKFSALGGAYWDDYKGQVSEMRFYSRAKNVVELQSTWSQPPSPVTSGLVGSFRMVEPSGGQTCDDFSASRCIRLLPQQQPIWSSVRPPNH